MVQGTDHSEGLAADDPETIHAEMAKTRAALTRELGALKSRVFGTPTPARKGRKSPVAKSKSATKSKPASKAKSATKSKPAAKAKPAAHSKASARKTTSKSKQTVGNQTTKVLGKMLAGAALGAVKGAAEAVIPATAPQPEGGKRK